MSNASVDLPEPETPVITLNRLRGTVTSMFCRLCSRALWMRMAWGRYLPAGSSILPLDCVERGSAFAVCSAKADLGGRAKEDSYSRSALPVWEVGCSITSAGVPQQMRCP